MFFVSDQTGVTAETMGHSLLTQFDGLEFRPVTLPFVSSLDKAEEAVRKINLAAAETGVRHRADLQPFSPKRDEPADHFPGGGRLTSALS